MLYTLYRLWGARRTATTVLQHLVAFRRVSVRPLLLVVHKFMNAEELDTEHGRERLQACVFRLPVDGRMVSMCEMNAKLRLSINRQFTTRSYRKGCSPHR